MKSRTKARTRAAGPAPHPAGSRRRGDRQGVRAGKRGKASGGRKSKKRREGRPSILRDAETSARKKIIRHVESYAALGFTNEQIAEMLGIGRTTLQRWSDDAEFRTALKRGKDKADALVIRALYNRAVGSKLYAADVTACIFWLKNRQPDRWRDKRDGTIGGPPETGGKIVIEVVQVRSRKRDEAKLEDSPAAAAGDDVTTEEELEDQVRRLEREKARLIERRRVERDELERRSRRVDQVKRARADAERKVRDRI